MKRKLTALWVALCLVGNVAAQSIPDFTDGCLIVNEDWFGHNNSTVNHLSSDGTFTYRVIQAVNGSDVQLGCTAPIGVIYGDRFYVTSKQPKDGGASVSGGRLSVFHWPSLKILNKFEELPGGGDGRSFVGVDEHKGYVSTSNGICVLNLDNMAFEKVIEGTENPNTDNYGRLYYGQSGAMLRTEDAVLACHQSEGILVIDPVTDRIVKTIRPSAYDTEGMVPSTLCQSKDGYIWANVASTGFMGSSAQTLLKIDPRTFDFEEIDLPVSGPSQSWGAWTPDGLCASARNNVIYWIATEFFQSSQIYRYDIDTGATELFLDFSAEGWQIYGASFRVDPVSDDAFVSLFKDFGSTRYEVRRYTSGGELAGQYTMERHYWFPSVFVFPDNASPEPQPVEPQSVTANGETAIDLAGIAYDPDNSDFSMVKTVADIMPEGVVEATVAGGKLHIRGIAQGEATVTIRVCSNGRTVDVPVTINVEKATAISAPEADGGAPAQLYDLAGRPVSGDLRSLPRGIYVGEGKRLVK